MGLHHRPAVRKKGGRAMNEIEHYVTKVFSDTPEKKIFNNVVFYGVAVEYNCYGQKGITTLWFTSLEEAEQVKVGYMFLQ